jgi:hypothetical protein
MSGFSYKGIDIYTITNGSADTGTPVPSYSFKGTKQPTHDGLKPLPFGLDYQGKSLRDYCTAYTEPIITTNTTSTVDIPPDCKSFAFYGIAGGGGGGGGGGNANVNVNSGNPRNRQGGSGGSGTRGAYMSGYHIPNSGESKISIQIGTGGTAGNSGGNAQNNTSAGKGSNAKGGDGGAGNAGNETKLKIGTNPDFKTNATPGGSGGNGAEVKYNGTKWTANNGNSGSTPSQSAAVKENGSVNFPDDINIYGNGGGGGGHGTGGALYIIWLYD